MHRQQTSALNQHSHPSHNHPFDSAQSVQRPLRNLAYHLDRVYRTSVRHAIPAIDSSRSDVSNHPISYADELVFDEEYECRMDRYADQN